VIPLTSVSSDIDTLVVLERPNVAVSAGPLGTPTGVQLADVFQSPEIGSRSHWALSAYVTLGTRNSREQRIAARIDRFMVLPFFSPQCLFCWRLRVWKGAKNLAGKNVLRLIQIRLTVSSLEKISPSSQDNSPRARSADSSPTNAVNFSSA
jgi:hypothetical protein